MKHTDLLKRGRAMSGEEIKANLASLALDERFAAVLGLLDTVREYLIGFGAQEKLSEHHGRLAHTMGGLDVLRELNARIKEITDQREREGAT